MNKLPDIESLMVSAVGRRERRCFSTETYQVLLNIPHCKICTLMQYLHQLCVNVLSFGQPKSKMNIIDCKHEAVGRLSCIILLTFKKSLHVDYSPSSASTNVVH